MHKGEDAAYYLKKGHRVVGFEANPELVQYCRNRFAAEIAGDQLEIVAGAIANAAGPTVPFFVHATESVWGTLNPRPQ